MRTLSLVLLACLLSACDAPIAPDPAPAQPTAEAVVATVAPDEPAAQPHPASAAFGAWVTDGHTILVSADGIGPIAGGVATLSPYTVLAADAGSLALRAEDGTTYRIDLGDAPRMSSSALPSVALLPN